MKTIPKIVLSLSLMLYGAPLLAAPSTIGPDGSVTFEVTSVSIGIGGSKGSGVLNYKGYDIPFEMTGFSALEVGIAKKTGHGFVYNMANLSDFSGTYGAQTGAVTLLSGVGYQRLNKDGTGSKVFIELSQTEKGVNLGFTSGQVELTLDKEILAKTLAALNAPVEKRAFQSVYFDLNSATMRDSERPKLQELVAALRQGPASEVVITGYADTTGTAQKNAEISKARAQSVYTELKQLAQQKGVGKVPQPRVELLGQGEAGGPQGKVNQALRRVDVAVVYKIPQGTVYR